MAPMYRRLVWVVALFAMAGLAAAGWFLLRPTMRITFHVVGEDGAPIVGTPVTVWTFHNTPGGDRGVARTVRGVTNEKGLATVTMASRMRRLGYRVERPDHSGATGQEYVFQRASWGSWLPWDPTVEVTLKATQKPVAMYVKEVGLSANEIFPEVGQRVGYDLMVGDWIAPHGQGATPDFLFTYTELEKYQSDTQPFEVSLLLGFSNKGDGIQAGSQPHATGIRELHKAPEDGYSDQLRKRIKKKPDHPVDAGVTYPHYYFRVRTQLDEHGKVTSALYGKIDGDIEFSPTAPGRLKFKYSLNPTPNDRNVEADPAKNLLATPASTPATPAAPEKDATSEKEATVP